MDTYTHSHSELAYHKYIIYLSKESIPFEFSQVLWKNLAN